MERAGLECERARCNKCMRITIAFNKGTFFQFLDRRWVKKDLKTIIWDAKEILEKAGLIGGAKISC